MIKVVLIGLWSSAIAIAAVHLGAQWGEGKSSEVTKAAHGKLAHVRVKPLSVPFVSDGKVSGYIVAQLSYTAPAEKLKKLEIKPDVFLYDAAFSAIYTGRLIKIDELSRDSLKLLGDHVKESVNARLGEELVVSLIVEELGYVPYDQSRGAAKIVSTEAHGAGKKKAAKSH